MKNKKRGRKKIEITEEIIEVAYNAASRGMTKEQIAQQIGIGYRTLFEKIEEYPQLLQAIKEGQANGIGDITNALYQSALDGNTTAQIFYLKNRAGWKDKQEVEHSGSIDIESTVLNGLDSNG